MLEEVVRSKVVQAQVDALNSAEEARRFPDYKTKSEASLAEAGEWQEFLLKLRILQSLQDLSISQPTLRPLTND